MPPLVRLNDSEVTTAYNQIFVHPSNTFSTGAGLASTQSLGDLSTNTELFGNKVYTSAGTVSSTSGITLTFNAQGDPTEIFVQINGTLTFNLAGGAQASNIFWIVQDAATISVGSSGPIVFDGDILTGSAFTMSAAAGGTGMLRARSTAASSRRRRTPWLAPASPSRGPQDW